MTEQADKVEAFLLIKLMEECAEVTQACSKILEHGFWATNAETGIVYDNQCQLAKELGDVLAVMQVLCATVHGKAHREVLNLRMIEAFAVNKRKILRDLASRRSDG